jgi:hypothetical protein
VYTVAQKYCRFLVLQKLDQPNVNVDLVIKAIRRLPWDDPEEKVRGRTKIDSNTVKTRWFCFSVQIFS